jgi:hypothetical protein
MIIRPIALVTVLLAGVAVSGCLIGRRVEEAALAAERSASIVRAPAPSVTSTPGPPSYQELQASDVLALRFSDFYEALRSAPGEARRQWAAELEQVPVRSASHGGGDRFLQTPHPVRSLSRHQNHPRDQGSRHPEHRSRGGCGPSPVSPWRQWPARSWNSMELSINSRTPSTKEGRFPNRPLRTQQVGQRPRRAFAS